MDNKQQNVVDTEHGNQLHYLHKGLVRTVDFGIEILMTDLERGSSDLDLPVLLFLRNLISTVDGIAVLINNSIIEPANNLLRTALENFFSIEYLLGEDHYAAQRASSFLVWHAAEQQRWLKKGDVLSPEYQALVAKHKKDKAFSHVPVMIIPMADKQWDNIEASLKNGGLKDAKAEYDRVKQAKRKSPIWYNLYGGPASLEDLANRVGYPAVYEMLYRGLSISSHGNNIISGKLYVDEMSTAELASLRNSYGAESIVHHCMNFCKMAYRTVITKRMPSMAERYNEWIRESTAFNRELSAMVQQNIEEQDRAMKRSASTFEKDANI